METQKRRKRKASGKAKNKFKTLFFKFIPNYKNYYLDGSKNLIHTGDLDKDIELSLASLCDAVKRAKKG